MKPGSAQTIGQLSPQELKAALRGPGLRVATGPFNCSIRSNVSGVAEELSQLYAQHPMVGADEFIDFHVKVDAVSGLRRWFKPLAEFSVDEVVPFKPMPLSQALPMIEWGMNWCITAYSHHVLILHAAAIAKDDLAMILPAPPGSGKSTLCAALVNRGWRLLSDELTIIRLDTGEISGLARPVSLKNASIEVIRQFAPEALLTRPVEDTTKGTVALMGPSADSVARVDQPARPRWMVLPRYRAGAATTLTPMGQGAAFLQIAENAMNYHILGAQGFAAVGELVDACEHFSFEYSNLDEAIALFDGLAASA